MPDTIVCSNCQQEIEISEALSSQLRAELRKQFEAEHRKMERALADRDEQINQRARDLAAKEKGLDDELAKRLAEVIGEREEALLKKDKELQAKECGLEQELVRRLGEERETLLAQAQQQARTECEIEVKDLEPPDKSKW